MNLPFYSSINTGWQCPKCSAVMSPTTPCCFYCKPNPQPAITTTTIPLGIDPKIWTESLSLCRHGVPTKFNCHECSVENHSSLRQHYGKLMDDEIEINRGCHV